MLAGLNAGSDVQKHQLVGPHVAIAGAKLYRISFTHQVDKLDPFHYLAVVNVQAGDNAPGQSVWPPD
ncbi:hypothetical protein ES703_87313 [subsurface metagenome]